MGNAGRTTRPNRPRSRQQPKATRGFSVAVSITRPPTTGPHPLPIGGLTVPRTIALCATDTTLNLSPFRWSVWIVGSSQPCLICRVPGAPRNLAVGSGYPSQSPANALGWARSPGRGRSRTTSSDLSQSDQDPVQFPAVGSNLTSKLNGGISVRSLKWMISRLPSKTPATPMGFLHNITAKFEAGLDEVKNSVGMNHALRKPPPRRIQCGT